MRRCAFSTNNKYDRYIITAPARGPYFFRSTALPPEDPPDGVPYAGAPPAETIRAVRQPAGEGQAGAPEGGATAESAPAGRDPTAGTAPGTSRRRTELPKTAIRRIDNRQRKTALRGLALSGSHPQRVPHAPPQTKSPPNAKRDAAPAMRTPRKYCRQRLFTHAAYIVAETQPMYRIRKTR